MPSSISHAMAAAAIAATMMPRRSCRGVLVVGMVCAIVPDVDALPRLVGGGDLAILGGHRGITHSVMFALATAGAVSMAMSHSLGLSRVRLFGYVALATLSHGVLDAFSDYGGDRGVAFLSPFSRHRFEAPWQPIAGEFSELLLCLLPLALVTAAGVHVRRIPVSVRCRGSPVQLRLHTLDCETDRPLQPESGPADPRDER